jgi:CHAT domain-containing protein
LDNAAAEVARLVWRPIAPHLKGARTVLIAPDGPLCFLPFAALPGRNSGTYLLEEFAISYVPSARQLYDLHKAAPVHQTGLLAVGDVQYATSSSRQDPALLAHRGGLLPDTARWRNLPASREEIEQVATLYGQVAGDAGRQQVLKEREATVKNMVAALSQKWRYVHFAGHGFFSNSRAGAALGRTTPTDSTSLRAALDDEFYVFGRVPLLLSGLVLAPEQYPARPGDAILTAEEVGSLDLRGTELVVLSACETGLGNTAGGEGVLGLQRAFFSSGARSTITSLWTVDDASTSLLMQQFYQNLWRTKLPKAEALRQAQLFVLNHPAAIRDQRQLLVARGVELGLADLTDDDANGPAAVSRTKIDDSPALPQRSPPAAWAAFVLYGDRQ